MPLFQIVKYLGVVKKRSIEKNILHDHGTIWFEIAPKRLCAKFRIEIEVSRRNQREYFVSMIIIRRNKSESLDNFE